MKHMRAKICLPSPFAEGDNNPKKSRSRSQHTPSTIFESERHLPYASLIQTTLHNCNKCSQEWKGTITLPKSCACVHVCLHLSEFAQVRGRLRRNWVQDWSVELLSL